MRNGIFTLIGVLLSMGCYTSRVGDFTAVANQSIGAPDPIKRGVAGEDCITQWQQGQMPSIEKAVDNAVRSVSGANALTSVEIDFYRNPFRYVLWGEACYRIRGDAVLMK